MKCLDNGEIALHAIDDEKASVYKLIPKKGDVYKYKKEEMSKIDKNKTFYVATAWGSQFPLFSGSDSCYIGGYYYDEAMRHLQITSDLLVGDSYARHSFRPWDKDTEEIIAKYFDLKNKNKFLHEYLAKYSPSTYLKVDDTAKIGVNALMLGTEYLDYYETIIRPCDSPIYMYPYIINIPMTLYYLELFMHGRTNEITEEQLKEILNLYNISDKPVYVRDISDVTNEDKYFTSSNVLDEFQDSAKKDAKVLKLIRK